jgi:hypothetical protein
MLRLCPAGSLDCQVGRTRLNALVVLPPFGRGWPLVLCTPGLATLLLLSVLLCLQRISCSGLSCQNGKPKALPSSWDRRKWPSHCWLKQGSGLWYHSLWQRKDSPLLVPVRDCIMAFPAGTTSEQAWKDAARHAARSARPKPSIEHDTRGNQGCHFWRGYSGYRGCSSRGC